MKLSRLSEKSDEVTIFIFWVTSCNNTREHEMQRVWGGAAVYLLFPSEAAVSEEARGAAPTGSHTADISAISPRLMLPFPPSLRSPSSHLCVTHPRPPSSSNLHCLSCVKLLTFFAVVFRQSGIWNKPYIFWPLSHSYLPRSFYPATYLFLLRMALLFILMRRVSLLLFYTAFVSFVLFD